MKNADLLRSIAGELLEVADKIDGRQFEEVESEYMLDGFSVEVSEYGARRHRAIDEAIRDLLNGDKFDRDVAEKADAWLAFDVKDYPGLAPDDEIRKQAIIEARNNAWGVSVVFARQSYHAPFKIKLPLSEQDAARNRYFDFVDGHAFIFIKNTTPQHYAEAYADSLRQEAVELRRRAGEDVTRPVPYRR